MNSVNLVSEARRPQRENNRGDNGNRLQVSPAKLPVSCSMFKGGDQKADLVTVEVRAFSAKVDHMPLLIQSFNHNLFYFI